MSETNQDLTYFVIHNAQNVGPFSYGEIEKRLTTGDLTAEAYVWADGMEEWLPLRQVDRFKAIIPAPVIETLLKPISFAGLGRRLGAGTIDLCLIVVIFEIGMLAFSGFRHWIEAASNQPEKLAIVNLALSAWVYIYYFLGFGSFGKGRTIGYKILKLRLVDQETGQVPSASQSLLWCLGSFVIPVGWIWYFLDAKRRMLQNIISKTIVIKA